MMHVQQLFLMTFIILISSTTKYIYAFISHGRYYRHDTIQFAKDTLNEDDDNNDSITSVSTSTTSAFDFEDDLFLERYKRRRDEAANKINAERINRPPSTTMTPKEVVTSILDSLLSPHDPLPYFGYEILYYTSCTDKWKETLRRSVGALDDTEEGLIYRALSTSLERIDTQFGILVGMAEETIVDFPFDTLDYYDGTAWLECRLRDEQSDTLLVVLGWSFKQRECDGAWLVNGIDWQDFRETFRPGIGREEWERICG